MRLPDWLRRRKPEALLTPDGIDILELMLDRSNGDILNIVQAAAEMPPGTVEERLSRAYWEVTGSHPGGEDDVIRLKDPEE